MPQIVVQPGPTGTKDAFTFSLAPAFNYGANINLQVDSGTPVFPSWIHSFIQMDLPALPVGTVLRSATLQLHRRIAPSADMLMHVTRIGASWVEGTKVAALGDPGEITWNNSPAMTGGSIDDPVQPPVDLGWFDFDITAAAKQWIVGSLVNNGVRISVDAPDTQLFSHFYSSDDVDPTKWPRILLDYIVSARIRHVGPSGSEFTSYITPDGIEVPFNTPHPIGRWVISQSGWGTPPIEYITQRGPAQHGETVKAIFLRPRIIQLLIRQAYCNREAWWDGRAELLNEIRPNRQATATATVPGALRRVLANGEIRDIDVFISEGPRFEPRELNRWDEWAFQEVLRFIAHNPVVYDPTRVDAAFAIVLDDELVFPITFDVALDVIRFGAGELTAAMNIDYVGTWESLPIIVITGRLEHPIIENLTTGERLELNTVIPAGRTVTIDLTYGVKTIVDDLGTNLIGSLTTDSDLATFHIAPVPEAPQVAGVAVPTGRNEMQLTGSTPNATTAVEIRYFTRYFGI